MARGTRVSRVRQFRAVVAAGMAVVAASAAPALAAPVNVTNGGFESLQTPANGSGQIGTGVGGGYNAQQNVVGWAATGLTFVFTPGTADAPGATGQYGGFALWGPNSPTAPASTPANALTAASPLGGNYIASDGAPSYQGSIKQTISGLSPGSVAQVSFDWAASQQYGFTGDTTEAWTVTLGGQTLTTPTVTNPSHGFTPWMPATLNFVVTSASEVLTFLATGTPDGKPPFVLLDGVSINQVPEPSTVAMMLTGLGLAALGVRRRGARG